MILVCANADAEDGAIDCHTSTQRPLDELVVDLADERFPELPKTAVRIDAGEQFCVTGRVDEDGNLVDLRLTEDGIGSPVIALRFEQLDGQKGTLLRVENRSDRVLRYRAAFLAGALNLAFPTTTIPVRPRISSLESWPKPSFDRLVLAAFRYRDPVPPPATPQPGAVVALPPGEKGDMDLTLGLGLFFGRRRLVLHGLNESLGSYGYTSLSTAWWAWGMALEGSVYRVRLGVELSGARQGAHSRTGSSTVEVGHYEGGVTLGYDVFREGPFSTFLSTGMLWGGLWVDPAARRYEEFDSRTAGLCDADTVARESTAVLGEVGAEYRIPLERRLHGPNVGMVLGFRAGYVREIARGGWVARHSGGEEDEIGGGPDVDMSGMRYRAAVAFALF
jgi:hypothetical protein